MVEAGLLDVRFLTIVSGYKFTVALSENDYVASAMRASANAGRYEYFSTADAVVRYSTGPDAAPKGRAGHPVM
jgi:hypothetical protein